MATRTAIGTPIKSKLDTRSVEYRQNLTAMQTMWDDVAEQLASVPGIGGQRYVDRHRRRGKMLVRERVEALVDPDTPLLELQPLAGWGTQDPVGVGIFNGPAGSVAHAKRLGLQQHDAAAREYHSEFLTMIGSRDTLAGKQRYYAIDRRGGYPYGEGHGSSNNAAPLPINLRYDGTPSALTLPVWEPVKPGTVAALRLILFNHVEGDEVTVQLNGTTLNRDLVDPQWKDARIFSPLPQPETVTPGNVVKNLAVQKLTRVEFKVPVASLKRGPNTLVIAVNRTGPFPASRPVKVEKVELHLK